MARRACIDGNEAAARVAHALSEVVAIYPITPASPMGELADTLSANGTPNLWGAVPEVIELQSEAGAAGALHGALLEGALATTFTSSQGLLLMLPNMFKVAGELLPGVIHVAARAVATHALSIFGDHSDVMAARTTGWTMLVSSSVQEAHDLALVAHAAALRTRVPVLHFFDGFRTSHEVATIDLLDDHDLRALIDEDALLAHRGRRLNPDRPVIRGTSQNPDVFFQSREAANPYHDAVAAEVAGLLDQLGDRTGRRYHVVDYVGAPDADRIVVLMGSAAGAAEEAVEALVASGDPVGVLKLRLFRPFPTHAFLRALPSTVRSIAVLDRTKEPGSIGEPLYLDVVAALAGDERRPAVIGGRYGLASKELTPAMIKAVFDELTVATPRRQITVGIDDDVTHMSVVPDPGFSTDTALVRAVFYGLGSDGTVGATKSSAEIIADGSDLHAQAYAVYDSKKSGAMTVSHLRVGPEPIRSTYLVSEATFVACHQPAFLGRVDVLGVAAKRATFLLNTPHRPEHVWKHLPTAVQTTILEKQLEVWVVDATKVAREVGLGRRINTVMQACFFALAGVVAEDDAVARLKASIGHRYGTRGEDVVARNLAAVDAAVDALARLPRRLAVNGTASHPATVPQEAPPFAHRVTAPLLLGHGDELPVSALPADGTFPLGTSRYERRQIADELPIWDARICIDCGKCAIVCPHAAIRMKAYEPDALDGAPPAFASKHFRSRDLPGRRLTVQVSPDDCTGCGVCVEICPVTAKDGSGHKALDLLPAANHRDRERRNWDFFRSLPELDRALVTPDSVKLSQLLEPLFEFSGACAGCGETPYLKLVSQLFGDRAVIANATGCSSIFGGNLPTTPWTTNVDGRGPAWANSLFEDNAEFGLGLRLALDAHHDTAVAALRALAPELGDDLVTALLEADQSTEAGVIEQRSRVAELRSRLGPHGDGRPEVTRLLAVVDELVRRSLWVVGGDGWAYDIGSGGLDHLLASGRDVNILVLDTEVYSNTGGQASKATPRRAAAKFAVAGKRNAKKDLGLMAMSYGDVYVAQIALGGSDVQTVKALLEADAWPGVSLVIAYASCVPAHGFDERQSMAHQRDAVRSGHWPLFRYHPGEDTHEHPFHLDSREPTVPVRDFALSEQRFAQLARRDPERAERLLARLQGDVDERWRLYEQLAGVERTAPVPGPAPC